MARTPRASGMPIKKEFDRKRIEEEKKKLKNDQKRQRKEAKKRAKEIAAQEASLDDEESNGAFTFLATVAIVVIWVGIICVIIKLDVGGFGSGVLKPILKDVPVVNLILPGEKEPATQEELQNPEGYTLQEALAKIERLELELEQAKSGNLGKDETIAELKAEIVRLQEFESKQVEFQRIKTEFYEEVIYAENGPGAEEYRKYYEEMDPSTAEYLYKQVVIQMEESKAIKDYAAAYSSASMKPKQAAGVFESMTNDLDLVARILSIMTAEDRGAILGAMDPEVAAKLTKIMDPES